MTVGTGKTLVAGALATELNKEGHGKVVFYQRKGADILDKWVGESERKLRELFNQVYCLFHIKLLINILLLPSRLQDHVLL